MSATTLLLLYHSYNYLYFVCFIVVWLSSALHSIRGSLDSVAVSVLRLSFVTPSLSSLIYLHLKYKGL